MNPRKLYLFVINQINEYYSCACHVMFQFPGRYCENYGAMEEITDFKRGRSTSQHQQFGNYGNSESSNYGIWS